MTGLQLVEAVAGYGSLTFVLHHHGSHPGQRAKASARGREIPPPFQSQALTPETFKELRRSYSAEASVRKNGKYRHGDCLSSARTPKNVDMLGLLFETDSIDGRRHFRSNGPGRRRMVSVCRRRYGSARRRCAARCESAATFGAALFHVAVAVVQGPAIAELTSVMIDNMRPRS